MTDIRDALHSLRRQMELRWTGQFVENAVCTIDAATARITALEASLAEAEGRVIAARRQALEEAAKACEAHMSQCLDDRDIQKRWPQIKAHNAVYAGVVRAVKDSPPPPTVV